MRLISDNSGAVLKTVFIAYFTAAAILTIGQLYIEYQRLAGRYNMQIQEQLRSVSEPMSGALWYVDEDQLVKLPGALLDSFAIDGVSILDADGFLVFRTGGFPSAMESRSPLFIGEDITTSNEQGAVTSFSHALVNPIAPNEKIGEVVVHNHEGFLVEVFLPSVGITVISAVIKALALGLLLWLAARQTLLAPINRLKQTAKFLQSYPASDGVSSAQRDILGYDLNELADHYELLGHEAVRGRVVADEQLRIISDISGIGVVTISPECTLQSANYAAEVLLESSDYSNLTELLSKLSSSTVTTVDDSISRALKELSTSEMRARIESAGMVRHLSMKIGPRPLGEQFGAYIILQCITAQANADESLKSAQSALEQTNRELKSKAEKQAQMLSIVSHELRTPLASTDMIYKELSQDNLDQYMSTLIANSDTVLSIMDDLRMVIRPDQIPVKEQTTDLPALVIERTLSSLTNLAERHEIKTHLSFDALSKQKMLFSTAALRQLVTNLTKNAILHSEGDNVWVDVETTLNQSDKALVIVTVEDDGMGISPDFRETMYEAFTRGQTSADGTGLGLYIIKELASGLEGNIEYFESDRGGAGFRLTSEFELPPVEKTPKCPKFTEEKLEQTLYSKRVLFAEDQLTIQILTKNVLTKAGADVTVASNGQLALEAYSEASPDIVITDAMMPEMDGYQLSSQLREEGYTGPIIVVTAATIGDERDRLLEAGTDVVLPKPINLDDLKLALADWEQNREQA